MSSRRRACASLLALAALFALVVATETASTASAEQQGKARQATARVAESNPLPRPDGSRVRSTARRATVSEARALRKAIRWHRSRTYYIQDEMGVSHTPTNHAERRWWSYAALRWLNGRWNHRQHVAAAHLRSILARSDPAAVPVIVCYVFGKAQCKFALHVAWGESRYTISAANGQYLGLFQMGSGERAANATIGYSTAFEQTVAAHNLYKSRGWEPWTCCGE